MYSLYDDWSFSSRVSPFGYRRVVGYLLLTAAFRSLSRPSSALSAKASTLRSFLLDHYRMYSVTFNGLVLVKKFRINCLVYRLFVKDDRLFRCLDIYHLVSVCGFQGTVMVLLTKWR